MFALLRSHTVVTTAEVDYLQLMRLIVSRPRTAL
jgi:hypothetical protein